MLNKELVKYARKTVGRYKHAQPGDPMAAGGAPPTDPSVGGMGGMPGGDPSAGGMPPAGGDPMAGGGGLTADSMRQIMMETMQQMGMQPGMGAGGKSNKQDQQQAMALDLFQIKKMLGVIMQTMGIEMPQSIIDGPNRDPGTGMVLPPNTPGSTSDPNMQEPAQPAAGGEQKSAIQPIQPMGAAVPQGDEKQSSLKIGEAVKPTIQTGAVVRNKAAALNAILRRKAR